jgi:hypothetical protein
LTAPCIRRQRSSRSIHRYIFLLPRTDPFGRIPPEAFAVTGCHRLRTSTFTPSLRREGACTCTSDVALSRAFKEYTLVRGLIIAHWWETQRWTVKQSSRLTFVVGIVTVGGAVAGVVAGRSGARSMQEVQSEESSGGEVHQLDLNGGHADVPSTSNKVQCATVHGRTHLAASPGHLAMPTAAPTPRIQTVWIRNHFPGAVSNIHRELPTVRHCTCEKAQCEFCVSPTLPRISVKNTVSASRQISASQLLHTPPRPKCRAVLNRY